MRQVESIPNAPVQCTLLQPHHLHGDAQQASRRPGSCGWWTGRKGSALAECTTPRNALPQTRASSIQQRVRLQKAKRNGGVNHEWRYRTSRCRAGATEGTGWHLVRGPSTTALYVPPPSLEACLTPGPALAYRVPWAPVCPLLYPVRSSVGLRCRCNTLRNAHRP